MNAMLDSPIIIGIIIGTIGSLLAYWFARDTVIPYFGVRLYPEAQINASYHGERTEGGVTYGFTLILRQSGRTIEGTFKARDKYEKGTESAKDYRLEGKISNNCMLLVYSGDDHIFGAGAFLLQVGSAGRYLRGGMLYLSTTRNETGAVNDLCLERR